MNIVVLLRLSNDGYKEEINPLVWAKSLKMKYGGQIFVLAMDSSKNKKLYEKCFEYGVNKVVLLSDSHFAGADVLATSRVIASGINSLIDSYDVIIAGGSSTFGETGLVPICVAKLLGIHFRFNVTEIAIKNEDEVYITETFDNYIQKTRESYPVLLSMSNIIDDKMYQKAKPTLFELMKVKNKDIVIYDINDIEIKPNTCGLLGSCTRVRKTKKIVAEKKHLLIENNNLEGVKSLKLQIRKVREKWPEY